MFPSSKDFKRKPINTTTRWKNAAPLFCLRNRLSRRRKLKGKKNHPHVNAFAFCFGHTALSRVPQKSATTPSFLSRLKDLLMRYPQPILLTKLTPAAVPRPCSSPTSPKELLLRAPPHQYLSRLEDNPPTCLQTTLQKHTQKLMQASSPSCSPKHNMLLRKPFPP